MLGLIDAKRNANLNSLPTSEMSTAFSSRTCTIEPSQENSILPIFAPQPPSAQDVSCSSKPTPVDGEFWREEVHTQHATLPLFAFCFISGYIDAISFTACFIWCGFQTGNTVQLALAIPRLFSGPNAGPGFRQSDQQALVSLLSFVIGGLIGRLAHVSLLGFAPQSRRWLFSGTLLQALFTLGATICAVFAHQSGFATRNALSWTDPAGFSALGFLSASMGLQGVMANHFGSHFGNAVVLTSVWIQLCSEPTLFFIRGRQKARDHKLLGIFGTFLGGFVGRALANTIHPGATLGVATTLRILIAISWLVVGRGRKV